MIPAHESTGGVSGDSGGDLDRCPSSGLLAEGRDPLHGRRVHDDEPSGYLNDATSDDRSDDSDHRRHDPGDDGDDHAPRGHHYDGRTYHYVLYSDVYLDIYDGSIYEYDGGYDLDNYRG
jgi:hypothetical protein